MTPAFPLARFLGTLAIAVLLGTIPGVDGAQAGEPVPPAILLARVMPVSIDPARYLVSEKLDGVRAIWDGHELHFRSGRSVPAPAWFTAALPAQPLDGELWLGRRRFDEISAIVRGEAPNDGDWHRIRYMLFELPGAPGDFAARVAAMQRLANAGPAWLQAVPQFQVADRKALEGKLREVVRAGGEGLMLHRADAAYETGRGNALLKLKPWQDAEATVIGHVPGKGKYAGMTGALLMQMPADQGGGKFRLGSGLSDEQRRNPPPLGSVITYRYSELTAKGLPRFPRYWRPRIDF